MKRFLVCALCVLCSLSVLVGCSRANKFGEAEGGRFVDKKTDIRYGFAPACYEPIAIDTSEVYGKHENFELYKIVGADPEKWLCESAGTVFYAEGVHLPALNEMNISKTELLIDTSRTAEVSEEISRAFIDAYCGGESIDRPQPSESEIEHSVMLRFSDTSIGLYYSLSYLELKEDYTVDGVSLGRCFVFNRFEGRCVAVSDLLAEYFNV